MEVFGFGLKAVHRESCPKCGAIVVAEVAGAQSLPDLKVMQNKDNFVPTEGACVVQEVLIILSNLRAKNIHKYRLFYAFVGY
jgi:predicted RNA-binding protein associated with RNAse of E/G family